MKQQSVRPSPVRHGPHRRPRKGGYARGEDTRARLIQTAVDVFGRRGYERASTREIAALAGVNPPALQYYFDSKEGLYFACIDLVTLAIRQRLEAALATAQEAVRTVKDLDDVVEACCALQDNLIDSFFIAQEGPSIWRLLAWEELGAGKQEARRLTLERINIPMFRAVSGLVGSIIGRPADDLQTGLQTFSICGQAMIFHLDEARIYETLGWKAPDEDGVQLVKSILRSQSSILLRGLASAEGSRKGCAFEKRGPPSTTVHIQRTLIQKLYETPAKTQIAGNSFAAIASEDKPDRRR